jgi:hypothetical protein
VIRRSSRTGEPEEPSRTPETARSIRRSRRDDDATVANTEGSEQDWQGSSTPTAPSGVEDSAADVPLVPEIEPPREWNLWDLERLARERSGADPARDEEWSFLLMYLREFARPDGGLPIDFDGLVRESFAELARSAY